MSQQLRDVLARANPRDVRNACATLGASEYEAIGQGLRTAVIYRALIHEVMRPAINYSNELVAVCAYLDEKEPRLFDALIEEWRTEVLADPSRTIQFALLRDLGACRQLARKTSQVHRGTLGGPLSAGTFDPPDDDEPTAA